MNFYTEDNYEFISMPFQAPFINLNRIFKIFNDSIDLFAILNSDFIDSFSFRNFFYLKELLLIIRVSFKYRKIFLSKLLKYLQIPYFLSIRVGFKVKILSLKMVLIDFFLIFTLFYDLIIKVLPTSR